MATFVTPPQRVELSLCCSILLKVQSSDKWREIEWRLVLFGIIHKDEFRRIKYSNLNKLLSSGKSFCFRIGDY